MLYNKVKDYVGDADDKILFDLYCGTGTIAQILSDKAKAVYGIEIVEEAVEAAKMNSEKNAIDNCVFICGDVLEKVEELDVKPDVIVLDPPRAGIHPKAIDKIISFAPDTFRICQLQGDVADQRFAEISRSGLRDQTCLSRGYVPAYGACGDGLSAVKEINVNLWRKYSARISIWFGHGNVVHLLSWQDQLLLQDYL